MARGNGGGELGLTFFVERLAPKLELGCIWMVGPNSRPSIWSGAILMLDDDKLRVDIFTAYRSLKEPSWAFVTDRKWQKLHRAIAEELPEAIAWEDTTDLNYDVCTTLSLSTAGASVVLLLSRVGDYAVLIDTGNAGASEVLIVPLHDPKWAAVVRLLDEHGYQILGVEELVRPSPLNLPLCAESGCKVYNALFRDQASSPLRARA
jgi:hypothetical protein